MEEIPRRIPLGRHLANGDGIDFELVESKDLSRSFIEVGAVYLSRD